jgi:dCTP deaminase
MILSDADILSRISSGEIICEPFNTRNLSNSSIDLRLGGKVLFPATDQIVKFDLDEDGKVTVKNPPRLVPIYLDGSIPVPSTDDYIILHPNDFCLAQTLEYVGSNSSDLVAEVCDKSTLARLGLSVCFSAGYIDAGNALNITLEIKNQSRYPIELKYGMHICQIKFVQLSSACMNPYSGKYKNSKAVAGAK